MRIMRKIFRMEVIDADMGGEQEPKFDAAAFAKAARARREKNVALAGSAKETKTQAERSGERTRARDKSRGYWGSAFSVRLGLGFRV